MSTSVHAIAWLADPIVRDLIQRFPLPIALIDDAGETLFLNDRFKRTYDPEVLYSAPLQDIIHKSVPDWTTIRVRHRGQDQVEIKARMLRVQRNQMLILDDAVDTQVLRKLDQLQGQVTELARLSSTDPLTGAWNRAHFDRVVVSELDRSFRFKQPVSLIFVDIDGFKQVNDACGHRAGDFVLCEVVQVIGSTIRLIDMLFRWGGDEFVVLTPSTGYRGGATLAEKMRRKMEQHCFAGIGSVTISLGVAEHIAPESAEMWFSRADEAVYRAKSGGRNRIFVDQRGCSDLWAADRGLSVTRLIWNEAYECGEPTIDRQHRELFDLSNALFAASFEAESSPEAFAAALERLLAHIARHFVDEEILLAERGYEDLEAHRSAHARLLARAAELKASAEAGKATLGDLVEFLANEVVAQHMFKEDRKFFPLFSGHPA
jgi:diguanylate cyclase (GGDEF)-like protein/hemerythrin-like metal-binding protein